MLTLTVVVMVFLIFTTLSTVVGLYKPFLVLFFLDKKKIDRKMVILIYGLPTVGLYLVIKILSEFL